MPTVQDILLGDFDMTKASKAVQYATASAVAEHVKNTILDPQEAENVARFMKEVSDIPRIVVWSHLQGGESKENLFAVHPHVWQVMVDTATSNGDIKEFITSPREERDGVLRKLGYLL